MTPNGPSRDNGHDTRGIDYERLYRRTKRSQLEGSFNRLLDPALHEYLTAIEEGENEQEAYLDLLGTLCEFAEVSLSHLESVEEFDTSKPENDILVQGINLVAQMAADRSVAAFETLSEINGTAAGLDAELSEQLSQNGGDQ